MTRETAAAKARRYVVEGRLTVLEVGPQVVRAVCLGDGQVYWLGWWRGSWGCTCDASQFRATCSHLLALRLVVVEPRGTAGLTTERMLAEQDEVSRVCNGRRSA